MSIYKKTGYFVLLIIIVIVILLGSVNDRQYILDGERFEVSENGTLSSPYLSLWNGNYTFYLDYHATTDVPIKLLVDKKECMQGVLSAEQEQLEWDFLLGINTDLFQFTIPSEYVENIKINRIVLVSDGLLYTDTVFYALFVLIIGLIGFWIINGQWWTGLTMTKKTGKVLMLISVVVVSMPFMTDGIIAGWDTWGHLLRIESVKDSFYLRQFPVLLFPKNCNGYGQLGAMYPLTPLYLTGIFRSFHMSIAACYKLVFILANIATVISTYVAVKSVSDSEYTATFAAILYCLAPYRIMNLFCRQAMGEIIAMIFVPLVIVGLYHIFWGKDKKYWFLLVIGYCGIIQAHVISVLLIMLLSVLVGLLNIHRLWHEDRWKRLVKAIVFTLTLNIWFLIPFFTFMKQGTNNSIIFGGFLKKGTTLSELIANAHWAYDGGLGIIGCTGAACIICGVACVIWLLSKKRMTESDKFMSGILGCSILFIWMGTAYFPWTLLAQITIVNEVIEMLQFPFRFLIIGTPLLIVSVSYFIGRIIKSKYKYAITMCILILNLAGILGFMQDFVHGEEKYDKLYGGITEMAIPENYPLGADGSSCRNNIVYPYSYEMNIQQFERNGNIVRIIYSTSKDDDYIDIPIYYFVGYSAEVIAGELPVGTKLRVEQGAEYRVRVYTPKSEYGTEIKISYTGLWLFYIGYIISTIAIILFIVLIMHERKTLKK